jgi:hypothetical protein
LTIKQEFKPSTVITDRRLTMNDKTLALKDTLIVLSTFVMCVAPLFPYALDSIAL